MNLTERERKVLKAIKDFIAKNDYPPTVRELGRKLGLYSSSSVYYHLIHLRQKGAISWVKRLQRTLRIR